MSHERDIPVLEDGTDYSTWKKKVEIWKLGTNAKPAQQAAKLIMHMKGKPQDVAINLDKTKIGSDTGVDHLTEELDKLYKKDTTQSLFKAIDSFEKYRRKEGEDIDIYISEFQRRYKTLKQLQSNKDLYDDVILAYRLLNQASLNGEDSRLVRATCTSGLTFEKMQEQLKRTFGDSVICVEKQTALPFKTAESVDVKQEVFYTNRYPDYQNSTEPEVEEEFGNEDNREMYRTSQSSDFKGNRDYHHNNPRYNPYAYANKRGKFQQRPYQQRGIKRPSYPDRRSTVDRRTCFICKQPGHVCANCPLNPFQQKTMSLSPEDQQKRNVF